MWYVKCYATCTCLRTVDRYDAETARFEDPPTIEDGLSTISGPKFCLSCHRLDNQRKVRICLPASVCLPLFTCLSAYLCLPVCLSLCLPLCLSPSACLCLPASVCLPLPSSLSVCLRLPLCLPLLVCLPLCLSASLSVCLPLCLSASVRLPLSVCLSVCLSASQSASLSSSVCLPLCLSVCLSVCLSAYLSAYLSSSVCLPLCLSVCLSVCIRSNGGGGLEMGWTGFRLSELSRQQRCCDCALAEDWDQRWQWAGGCAQPVQRVPVLWQRQEKRWAVPGRGLLLHPPWRLRLRHQARESRH